MSVHPHSNIANSIITLSNPTLTAKCHLQYRNNNFKSYLGRLKFSVSHMFGTFPEETQADRQNESSEENERYQDLTYGCWNILARIVYRSGSAVMSARGLLYSAWPFVFTAGDF
ncbi:hypothetical protein J6590_080522 [Homalodisca vitripennis]|nr:hypothetical protein J6590_080522 [Homalodisca vitripennis]